MTLMGPTFRSTSTAATAALLCFVCLVFHPRSIAASHPDTTWDANWTIASAPFGDAAAAGERKLCMGHEFNLIGVK